MNDKQTRTKEKRACSELSQRLREQRPMFEGISREIFNQEVGNRFYLN